MTRLPQCRRTWWASVWHPQQLAGIDFSRRQPTVADDRGNRSILKRGGHVIVPVHPLARHREEQLAGVEGARVDRVAHSLGVGREIALGVNPVGDLS
jgi:hypothetical protein